MLAQHLLQYLTAPGRVSRQQHAALEVTQERIQRCERLLGAHVDAQLARRGGGKIAHLGGGTVQLGLRLEGIEGDRCEPGERRVELGGLEKQLRGPEHRTLDVVAAILVARLDVLPGLDESLRERGVVDDHRIRGQVVEQCRGRSEEQRLIEFHPRGRESLAHAAINARAGRIPLEARAVAAAEILHRFRIQRHLARRQQAHARQRIERALRLRIKAADRLDLLVEEVDAQRRRAAHGEHVQQRAAHRELSGTHHLADARIARFGESLPERLDGERLPLAELERTALQVTARRQALHEGVGRHDQAAVLQLRQLEQSFQPLGDDVRMGGEEVVRQHFPVRQPQQRQRLCAEEAQLRREPLELARRVHDEHVQPPVGARGFGQRQRRGAAVQLMPAQTPVGPGRQRRIEQ